MNGMKRSGGRVALAVAIPLLIVPLAGLTWLAARSVDQQEGAMRARLRESLLLEVGQTNARIREWFAELPEELRANAPGAGKPGRPTARELAAWKEREGLVGMPFLLDAAGSIVYPDAKRSVPGDDKTRIFFWRYLNVFGNLEPIPVYRNIAAEYESSIVGSGDVAFGIASSARAKVSVAESPSVSDSMPAESMPAESMPAERGFAESAPDAVSVAKESVADFPSPAPASSEKARPAAKKSADSPPVARTRDQDGESALRSKAAQGIFESDAAVQRQVYDRAAEEGKETLRRNVNPKIDAINTRDSMAARSVYIESSRYFRDLVAQADSGIVPRIFDNTFVLLYWEKRGDWIVGCELDMGAVREAIAALSGTPADTVRFLAVLDQSGTPLVPVAGVETAAWRTPLVSGEISEFLPYWETAVILADESAFEDRVRASRYAASTLVLALFLSVALGAVILWRHSANRLLEARRRTGFVTTVSHELKTPLTSIRMYSEMLAGGANLDVEKRGRYLSRIVSESERLTRLINDVLDVSKLERGNRRMDLVRTDIARVARETVEGVADRLQASGFAVSFRADGSPPECLADREAVIRILLNLLSNAEKYSAGAREIEVRVGADGDRRRCLVSVADRGIGVPRAHRSRIFREFHRVDASLTSERGGTGLGLSIARSLARAMGGDVTYAPRDRVDGGGGGGSVFTLSLPLAGKKEGA